MKSRLKNRVTRRHRRSRALAMSMGTQASGLRRGWQRLLRADITVQRGQDAVTALPLYELVDSIVGSDNKQDYRSS